MLGLFLEVVVFMASDAPQDNDKTDDGAGLRPLTVDEVALIERRPMPKGVPAAIINRYQLATTPDKSKNTIDAWRLEGLIECRNVRDSGCSVIGMAMTVLRTKRTLDEWQLPGGVQNLRFCATVDRMMLAA